MRSVLALPLTTPRQRLGAVLLASGAPMSLAKADLGGLRQACRLSAVRDGERPGPASGRAGPAAARPGARPAPPPARHHAGGQRQPRPVYAPRTVAECLDRWFGHKDVSLWLPTPDGRHLRMHGLGGDEEHLARHMEDLLPVVGSPAGEAFRTGKPVRLEGGEMARLVTPLATRLDQCCRSFCVVPLRDGQGPVAVFCLLAHEAGAFGDEVVAWLERVAAQVVPAVANALAYREIESSRPGCRGEAYLEEEIRTEGKFDEIVGDSAALPRRSSGRSSVVAGTDSCRAHPRRDRHRQGADRPRAPPPERAGGADRS